MRDLNLYKPPFLKILHKKMKLYSYYPGMSRGPPCFFRYRKLYLGIFLLQIFASQAKDRKDDVEDELLLFPWDQTRP